MKIKPSDSTEWYKINGDNTYRINYPFLTSNSIVVDIGARHGDWSDIIKKRYNPRIYCFEVVSEFCEQLIKKGYTTYQKAVIDYNGKIDIGIDGDEGSIFHEYDKFTVDCIDGDKLFSLIGNDIDLMKINVEGAEYRIINNLIENGNIKKIKSLQVQFHVVENKDNEYNEIYKLLSKTHKLTWRFPFVWENWEII